MTAINAALVACGTALITAGMLGALRRFPRAAIAWSSDLRLVRQERRLVVAGIFLSTVGVAGLSLWFLPVAWVLLGLAVAVPMWLHNLRARHGDAISGR
jgi:hypothetical protein